VQNHHQLGLLQGLPLSQSSQYQKSNVWVSYAPVVLPDSDFCDALSYIEITGDYFNFLSEQIKNHFIYAVKFLDIAGAAVGYAVYKCDNIGDDRYLVLMHTVSNKTGFLDSIKEFTYSLARGMRCKYTRHHVNSEALKRILMRKFDCKILETVLFSEVPKIN